MQAVYSAGTAAVTSGLDASNRVRPLPVAEPAPDLAVSGAS